jgi:hypothetical protein
MALVHRRWVAVGTLFFTLFVVRPGVGRSQAPATNLLYTSISPCRVVDTRIASSGRLVAGLTRTFDVVGSSTDYSGQGGSSMGCGIPGFGGGAPQVQAVVFNFVAVGSSGPGDLVVWPTDHAKPLASAINFASSGALSGLNIANGLVIPLRQDVAGGDISVLAQVSNTHFVADVVGYFSSASAVQGGDGSNIYLGSSAGNPANVNSKNVSETTAIGVGAMGQLDDGTQNTAVGYFALTNLFGANLNTALGAFAGQSLSTGDRNVAIGGSALPANVDGSSNVVIGSTALVSSTTGSGNTVVGDSAGSGLKSGSSNILIGVDAGLALSAGESGNIYIGHNGLSGESNTIRIGPATGMAGGTIIEGIAGMNATGGAEVFVTSAGRVGTITSSLRFKQDVEEMGDWSNVLMRLHPVTFHYKKEYGGDETSRQFGLIAEEVAAAEPDLVQFDEDGWPLTVRYHLVNAMLLNEVQKQHRTIAGQVEEIGALRDESARLKARIEGLESALARVIASVDAVASPPLR